MPSPGSSLAGSKRKKPGDPKYYAVRIGKNPGIYGTYAECLEQVKGFKGAQFKSFTSTEEANLFIKHGLAAVTSSGSKYYAVKVGRKPGIYLDWPSAEAQIKGAQGPKYKSFTTMADAEAYMNGDVNGSETNGSNSKKGSPSTHTTVGSSAMGSLETQYEPGTGPLPQGAVDGFDNRLHLNPKSRKLEYKPVSALQAVKMQAHGSTPDAVLDIYTDGSSISNGQAEARAGIGVWFGPGDERNISERLDGPRQTNQRAELSAVLRALQIAPLDRHVRILTDSQYAINCVTTWFQEWERNGWISSSSRKPVENKDLVQSILARIRERMRCNSTSQFQWVKGHASNVGNTAADRLAVNGSQQLA